MSIRNIKQLKLQFSFSRRNSRIIPWCHILVYYLILRSTILRKMDSIDMNSTQHQIVLRVFIRNSSSRSTCVQRYSSDGNRDTKVLLFQLYLQYSITVL